MRKLKKYFIPLYPIFTQILCAKIQSNIFILDTETSTIFL